MRKSKPEKWLEYCRYCNKKHYLEIGVCPSCGVYEIAKLVSENACKYSYKHQKCDECEAYEDHLR